MSSGLEIILTQPVSYQFSELITNLHLIIIGDNVDVFHWSCIEIATAIICSCLPALRAMMGWLYPALLGGNHSSAGPSSKSFPTPNFDRKGSQPLTDIENIDGGASKRISRNHSAGIIRDSGPRWPSNFEETELIIMNEKKTYKSAQQSSFLDL